MLKRSADEKLILSLDTEITNAKSFYHSDCSRVDPGNHAACIERGWNWGSSVSDFGRPGRHDGGRGKRSLKQRSRRRGRRGEQRRKSLGQRLHQHFAERIDVDAKYRGNGGRRPPPIVVRSALPNQYSVSGSSSACQELTRSLCDACYAQCRVLQISDWLE
jgi:hypothetical protein